MARVDSALYHQKGGGLFRILGEMTAKTQEKYPGRPIVKLGVGDVTLPLAPAVLEALHAAVDEQGKRRAFTDTPETSKSWWTALWRRTMHKGE